MKKISFFGLFLALVAYANAQTPYQRVYTTLNTKCQNASCHSSTSAGDGPKFDGSQNAVYSAIFNVPSALWPSSVAKYEELINPQMPYQSFLMRKIAGAAFDTDLSLDSTGEGTLMVDTGGNPLSDVEIEWVRQWIRYGAMQTYSNQDATPDYNAVLSYYTDTPRTPFLPKPPIPQGASFMRFRCGPVFLPTSGAVEQEIIQQQEVHFPYSPEVYEIDGYLNEQSHHLLLFNYIDSSNARTPVTNAVSPSGSVDVYDIGQVTPATGNFTEPFAGGKNLTGAWQTDQKFATPAGTAFMWDQHTYLDMDYHTRNYNATGVLPCDFYFNVLYRQRNVNTIPMISHLVNNPSLGVVRSGCSGGLLPNSGSLPVNQSYGENYADQANYNVSETRYLWMAAGHTHSLGTGFYLMIQDSLGGLADTIYNGQYDYANGIPLGYWSWQHPPLEYWPHQLPVVVGTNGSGLVANTSWYDTVTTRCIYFGFTTQDEMQLFYYMYTTKLPGSDSTTGFAALTTDNFTFNVLPNPMNSNGKLVYNLDRAAKVEASIMDLTGKQIALLNGENQTPGVHEITIGTGQRLSAGMYFARITVNDVIHTKKFVVTE